jgi:transcriptional regulator GlxA family with amidase domain
MKEGDLANSGATGLTATQIGVLAYPGCFASEVYGIPDLLTLADRVAARPQAGFTATVMSPRRRVTAAGGLDLAVQALRPVDVLVVPGFDTGSSPDMATYLRGLGPEVDAIKAHRAGGGVVVSVCLGAFVLAEAGLLAGRHATTSWLYAPTLARMHPDVHVRPERLVVTEAGVTTTGGFSAMYDVALELIRADHGDAVATSTARVTLLDDSRDTQTPYVDLDLLPQGGGRFAQAVMRHLDQNLAAPYDLAAIATAAGVSPRTLLRRFAAETAESPLAYLQKARVRLARHLLETTDQSVASITTRVGYVDQATFARLFRRHVGLTPSEYRRSFGRSVSLNGGRD